MCTAPGRVGPAGWNSGRANRLPARGGSNGSTLFARSLADARAGRTSRPVVVAVDGRGGGGKTTLAERLCRLLPAAAVVHTDDVAWWHSRFGWDDLMIAGVLEPLHAGRGVRYRPPAWDARGRPGHIEVPAAARVVLIEGVGASRRSLADRLDVAVWVQSDYGEARRRGIDRDMRTRGLDEERRRCAEWDEWEAEEVPFLRRRPPLGAGGRHRRERARCWPTIRPPRLPLVAPPPTQPRTRRTEPERRTRQPGLGTAVRGRASRGNARPPRPARRGARARGRVERRRRHRARGARPGRHGAARPSPRRARASSARAGSWERGPGRVRPARAEPGARGSSGRAPDGPGPR